MYRFLLLLVDLVSKVDIRNLISENRRLCYSKVPMDIRVIQRQRNSNYFFFEKKTKILFIAGENDHFFSALRRYNVMIWEEDFRIA